MVVRGGWRREWLARRVAVTQIDAPRAAVVLDAWDRFFTGIACSGDADLGQLVDVVVSDPRFYGESMKVIYVETRTRIRPQLADLARWHDLVARHGESELELIDWMFVSPTTGRVSSMSRYAGAPARQPAHS